MSLIPPNFGWRARISRFNPIGNLTPQFLAQALDLFDLGYLRNAGLLWEIIEDRDDTLQIAAAKRRKAVSRRPYEILTMSKSAEAEKHKALLDAFFNNLTTTDATDENKKGGLRMVIRQMMNAVFAGYSVHEIVWSSTGGTLRAKLRWVPIYFFENRTGRLRFTGPEGGIVDGAELAENEWLITSGDSALMKAASVCYMLKRFSIQDWLNFSEKFGCPGIHGETPAARGTKEFEEFAAALDAFANDWVAVTSGGSKINLIEARGTGATPFEPMVERMDRRMTALCRGADLSTMSRTNAVGASLQEDEADILMEDDCEMISEALQTGLARFVIQWSCGAGVEPLAYIKVLPPQQREIHSEIKVDQFLLDNGGEMEAQETYERYGRTLPESFPKNKTLKATSQSPKLSSPLSANARTENDAPLPSHVHDLPPPEHASDSVQTTGSGNSPFEILSETQAHGLPTTTNELL